MQSAVELEQLRYSWNKSDPVISVADFSLNRGERLLITGASGSGKSTLLNLLGGIIRPDQGRISLLGEDITKLSPSEIDRFRADNTGFIFQQFNLLPYLNLIENVMLPCHFSGKRSAAASQKFGSVEAEARHLLERLGLADQSLQEQAVNELSTGQQQRVAAARALIGQPGIIIADEPTSALDGQNSDQFMQLLCEQCHAAGATLILVSHDLSLAPHFNRVEELTLMGRGTQT
ncbi:ABC transporter ATP-binding protein [uncultured Neptuniibacter sp.]|uniref:ABC transporter ATP-binding protein n=1 Tax=uncultured Neptuniibacter sp. TaxID=502143 RepID=UPI002629B8FC|nr:ABC transporter ATP-binding protein [uncultured Neptuniibacter sp.]